MANAMNQIPTARAAAFCQRFGLRIPNSFGAHGRCLPALSQHRRSPGRRAGRLRRPADATGGDLGLFALLPAVADAVRLPVVATGGIAGARGVAAALVLGASAAQIWHRLPAQRLFLSAAAEGCAGTAWHPAPRILEFGTLEAILACVSAGLGITLLPRSLVGAVARPGQVALHRLPASEGRVETVFIRRRDAYRSSALAAFLGALPQQEVGSVRRLG
jgi:DNA-binding transcriptional LysR family regulator